MFIVLGRPAVLNTQRRAVQPLSLFIVLGRPAVLNTQRRAVPPLSLFIVHCSRQTGCAGLPTAAVIFRLRIGV